MTMKDWHAHWIWAEGEASPRNEWRCFRKTFAIPADGIAYASLRITADSRYVLYVNGTRIGRGPVRSWPFEQSFDTYEVGHLLKPGESNSIAVLVMHYGVSTFYYLRGRGGLLVELNDDEGRVLAATDATWRTSLHLGHHPRAPRASCQHAYSEFVDAFVWSSEWSNELFDNTGWSSASVIGPVGMAPWTTLMPRDIPHLTDEVVSPIRVESLSKVKSFQLTTAIDVRNAWMDGSEDHANPIQFLGYAATVILSAQACRATLGFLQSGECLSALYLNGNRIDANRIYRTDSARFIDVELLEGDNLLVIDVSSWIHTGKMQIGLYADEADELLFKPPLLLRDDDLLSAWLRIGPFDAIMDSNHQATRALDSHHPVYLELVEKVKVLEDLQAYQAWLRPVDMKYVSEVDVFALCAWHKDPIRCTVPAQLQNAVIANAEAAIIPIFDGYDTEVLLDLGKEYSGYLSFEVEADEGTVLDWYGFEYMNGDYRQNTFGLDHTLRYICRTGRQRYESPIRRGLRYLALTVRGAQKPVKIFNVTMIQSNYPVAEVGRFACSDALLCDIWEISRHTTKLCMEDTFVDCPAYEQTFWVGDSRNEALVSNYLFGVHEIVKRCLRLVPRSKGQTPLYADQVPSGWVSVIPNWTFFWATACAEYYDQTGDEAFASEMYETIRFTLEHYVAKLNDQGLLDIKSWNLLDWSEMDQPNDGVVTHQNMFLVQALRAGARLGGVAGDSTGVALLEDSASRIAAAVNEHLWDENKLAYIDCIHADGRRSDVVSIQTQVVALLTHIAQGERKSNLEAYLLSPPPHFVPIGSPFMSFFYYEALAKMSEPQRIIEDIRDQYGEMIRHGATTCWETYPNFLEHQGNPHLLTRSHCHAWSSAPAYFLGREVLGVRSLAPGWSEVEIAPMPCGLSWAQGSVPHPAGGRIDVSWSMDESAKTMELVVAYPENVRIHAKLPAGYSGKIRESKFALV
ncbi:family 78 glycoside hydrolase catalytic domain [Paenibacillus guangzhouensis]|uniref:family 78 glycoside hydrolase catalytic domain n=1 Tax=Paenibacillus guangzhouensis TaxID=1473112 RepID=UPI001D0FE1D8|nr:family 78 glycoside hydrolase catalytic domain [Paenibacillus guangzhouensis]